MSKTKEVAITDKEIVDQLNSSFPSDPAALRISVPRLGMVSQDVTEETGKGKDKKIKVVQAAGTFFIEKQSDKVDEDGKKIWIKEEIGDSIKGIILYQRKQLRMYNSSTEQYTSSPVYDTDEEVIPLFANKAEVERGTPAELKQKYLFTDKDGKIKSALEDNKIIYVLYDGEIYQMNLRGSSMYSYMGYLRKLGNTPNTVMTSFNSTSEVKGDIAWNKMSFENLRNLTGPELGEVLEKVNKIKSGIAIEKASYANVNKTKAQSDFDALPGKSKDF